MKSIIFSKRRSFDEAGIKNNIPNTASSTTSSSPRVSWSKTVTRTSSPPLSSSPYASLGFSSSSPYASFGFFREDNDDSTPRRKKLMGTIERNTAGRSQSYTIQELFKSPNSKKKTLDTFSSSLPPSNNPSPPLVQSPTTSSLWKFALGRKNNLSKSSLSSTTGTDTEWETTSLIVDTTHNEMNPTTTNKWIDSLDNQSFHSSFDFSSIHFLDDILEHNKHHDKDDDDDDDDDTVLVDDTQSEPNMQQSAADQLFHYQMNRIKQDRNHIQERCEQLQKKYDTIKVKASLLRNVNQSLEANTEPIQRHVLDAKKSGNDIEQFLQGKPMVDPDDSVSEMTMDTYLYY